VSGSFAATQEISGVKVEDSAEVRGAKLPLNGAGIRYKGPFKVYVAGLYAGKKATSLDDLVNQPGPKRMQITMVRDIEANEFGKLLTRGMEDNTSKAEMSKLVPGLLKMGQLFSEHKKLVAGDSFSIDWIPGVGSMVNIKGKPQVEPFKEPEFYKALMGIWLGPVPADFKLKDALLGQ
jgi:Chalcone isomerase-like